MRFGKNIILFFLLSTTLTGCGGWCNGSFLDSPTILESKSHNYYRAMYIPDKFILYLKDKSIVKIDTAWAETMWGYDNNCKISTSEDFGYNFMIPLKQFNYSKCSFFILDPTNRVCEGGMLGKAGFVLNPKILKDTIEIFLKDTNPNPDSINSGWKPTVLDTVKFIKQ